MGGAESVLLQYGLAGVMIIGLTATVIKLWAENQKLQDKIYALQEARIRDYSDNVDKIAEPLAVIGRVNKMLVDKIADSKAKGV